MSKRTTIMPMVGGKRMVLVDGQGHYYIRRKDDKWALVSTRSLTIVGCYADLSKVRSAAIRNLPN